jgi:hypothetical protein
MAGSNGSQTSAGESVGEAPSAGHNGRGRRGRDLAARMRAMPDVADRTNEAFVGFVRERPLVALGAACVVGYVLGRMLRRVF